MAPKGHAVLFERSKMGLKLFEAMLGKLNRLFVLLNIVPQLTYLYLNIRDDRISSLIVAIKDVVAQATNIGLERGIDGTPVISVKTALELDNWSMPRGFDLVEGVQLSIRLLGRRRSLSLSLRF